MKYIIANWKANKTFSQANDWIEAFLKNDFSKLFGRVEVIICPPYPFIPLLHEKTQSLPCIKIGSQDISAYDEGLFTGEVVAHSLTGLISYAIIGHSKRRQFLHETEDLIEKKIAQADKETITPLLCIRNADDEIYPSVEFIIIEPTEAISSGTGYGANLSIEEILKIRDSLGITTGKLIYGGSVNEKNASLYLHTDHLDGVLVGGASLDPARFYSIVKTLE